MPNPVVDLRVFKSRNYTAGTGLNFLLGLALFGSSYLFSLYCGAVMTTTRRFDIGRIFLIAGLAQIVLMPMIGKIMGKVDPRLMLMYGVCMAVLSQYVASHLTSSADFHDLVLPNLIRSLGLGFVFIPVSKVVALSDLPVQQRGNATGLFNLTRELGGSLGTAWMGKVGADGIVTHTAQLAQHVTMFDPATQETWSQIAHRGLDPLATLAQRVSMQGMVLSFEDGFRLTTLAIGLGIFMVIILKRPPKNTPPPAGAH